MSSSSALEAASYGGARVDIGGPVDLWLTFFTISYLFFFLLAKKFTSLKKINCVFHFVFQSILVLIILIIICFAFNDF
jgi:hypothetical protein